mgnify:FL=1
MIFLYDALINFIGQPPAGIEPYLYIACTFFTLYLVSVAFDFLRVVLLRCIDGHS